MTEKERDLEVLHSLVTAVETIGFRLASNCPSAREIWRASALRDIDSATRALIAQAPTGTAVRPEPIHAIAAE